jgi:hypothetical protein
VEVVNHKFESNEGGGLSYEAVDRSSGAHLWQSMADLGSPIVRQYWESFDSLGDFADAPEAVIEAACAVGGQTFYCVGCNGERHIFRSEELRNSTRGQELIFAYFALEMQDLNNE